jgi:RimJ/RimL family protein N-acetyltransferase
VAQSTPCRPIADIDEALAVLHLTVVLETARLKLRPYSIQDFDPYFGMVSDQEVIRFISATPVSREDAWSRLMKHIGHWTAFGFGVFAVEERATGRFLGEVGIVNSRRGLGLGFDHTPEAGWVFTREASGQGLAFEAATAACCWFASIEGGIRTVCLIAPANLRSLRLAERLGYRLFAEGIYKGENVLMLESAPSSC